MKQKGSLSRDKGENRFDPLLADEGGGTSELGKLYEQYRGEFIGFAYKYYNLSESDAGDIFQESFIAFYQNLSAGRLKELTCSVRTYIFQIGKYKILNLRRRKQQVEYIDLIAAMQDHYSEDTGWSDRQELVYEIVAAMREPCNKVLTMFYWKRMSMRDIAEAMNYGNEQVAKNRKALCIKKLREDINLKENE